jgi:hypothetical protein
MAKRKNAPHRRVVRKAWQYVVPTPPKRTRKAIAYVYGIGFIYKD